MAIHYKATADPWFILTVSRIGKSGKPYTWLILIRPSIGIFICGFPNLLCAQSASPDFLVFRNSLS